MADVVGYAPVDLSTTRGFTGHEMLDSVGLVHMNGCVCDPALGRFISPDPLIEDWMNPLKISTTPSRSPS